MLLFPPTLILRHRKENLKKCSLRGLETRSDCRFFIYPKDTLPDLSNYLLLKPNAPILTPADKNLGIFLIDGTWRYAATMFSQLPLPHSFVCRSLPNIPTAYPRRQDEPEGLASVEALYIAYLLLGRNPAGLLDHYHWKERFLSSIQ